MQQLIIIKRQFQTMNKQVTDNFPSETGGFIGGKNNIVLGIYPVANKFMPDMEDEQLRKTNPQAYWKTHNRTTENLMSFSQDDVLYGQEFFKSKNMTIMGMYHSHPNAAPIPSREDMEHLSGDSLGRVHLIFGIHRKNPKSKDKPIYRVQAGAFYCPSPREIVPLELKIVDNNKVDSYLISSSPFTAREVPAPTQLFNNLLTEDEKIAQMINEGKATYKKDQSTKPGSTFSTES